MEIKKLNYEKFFTLNNIEVRKGEIIQILGLLNNKFGNNDIDESIEEIFLKKCTEVVEESVIDAVLQEPFMINAVSKDIKLNRYVHEDGSKFKLDLKIEADDNIISDLKDIEFRQVFLFYFYTKLTRQELIDKFGNCFCLEGEMPKEWHKDK